MTTKQKTLVGGVSILGVAGIICKVVGVLYRIPLAHLIGPEGMGVYHKVYPAYNLLLTISSAGLPVAISRMVAHYLTREDPRNARRIFSMAMRMLLVLGLLTTLLMLVFSGRLAAWQGTQDTKAGYMAIAPSLFFVCVMSAFRGFLQGQRNMVPTAVSQLIEQIGRVFIALPLAYFGMQRGGVALGAVSVVVDAKGKATVDCRGYADLEAKTPMRPDSLFWLASNTKAIAAATLMTLVDEGKVNLDDLVSKYLPAFADVKVAAKDGPRAPVRPMTVRMTLSHMSGLPFFPGMPIDKRSIAELAHLAAITPLAVDPGERYAYSNWGIDVAMAVVEKVTGRSFAAVMKERILDPLGMKDATFVPSEEQMTRLAKSYRLSDNLKPREIKIAQFRYPYTDPTREPEGGGGLFGTADDLCRFFRMLAAGGTAPDGRRILSELAVREMTRRQTPDRPKITSYGFGLNVKPNFVGHGGAYGTYAAFDPQTKAVRVLCISMSGTTKQRTAFQAAWNKASLAGTATGDVTYRAAPEGVPGAVLVTADADGAPRFECVGEAAPGRRMEPDTVFWMARELSLLL